MRVECKDALFCVAGAKLSRSTPTLHDPYLHCRLPHPEYDGLDVYALVPPLLALTVLHPARSQRSLRPTPSESKSHSKKQNDKTEEHERIVGFRLLAEANSLILIPLILATAAVLPHIPDRGEFLCGE